MKWSHRTGYDAGGLGCIASIGLLAFVVVFFGLRAIVEGL